MSRIPLCLTKIPSQQKIVNSYGDRNLRNVGVARAAFGKDIQWSDGQIIKIGFFRDNFMYEGNNLNPNFSIEKAKWVKTVVEKYLINPGVVNLSFEWDVPLEQSDIRITFIKEMGAWSTLGIQALYVPKDQPTMNLGWLDTNDDYDFAGANGTGAVVIHEFGHAIGLIHEHSRGDAVLNWNKEAVYNSLGQPPNSWSREMVDQQIFNPQEFDSSNSSEYDSQSIMHYYFPDQYFLDPTPNLIHASQLSDVDIEVIKKRYPGGGAKSIGNIIGDTDSSDGGDNDGDNGGSGNRDTVQSAGNKSWFWIFIFCLILLVIILVIKNKDFILKKLKLNK